MITKQGNFQPRPQPPAPQINVGLFGQILFPPGPWGSRQPARTCSLLIWEGWIASARLPNQVKISPAKSQPALLSTGEIVKMEKRNLLSSEIFTNAQGKFRLSTKQMSANIDGMILEIRDWSQILKPTDQPFICYLQLLPGLIDLRFTTDQSVGTIILPWFPPLSLTTLARVNSTAIIETQKLVSNLLTTLKSPSYPIKITLTRQAQDENVNYDGLTAAQRMLEKLTRANLPADFPDLIVKEINKIPILPTGNAGTANAIVKILERLSTINITEVEKGTVLNSLLNALDTALGGWGNGSAMMEDAAADMSAACVLLFIAALLAKDKVKPIFAIGSLMLPNDQKIMTIEVSVIKEK